MIIKESKDIGKIIRQIRKSRNMTQAELAVLCKVGVRFIGELEYGKQTAMLGKTLQVINKLGITMQFIIPQAPKDSTPAILAAYNVPWSVNK